MKLMQKLTILFLLISLLAGIYPGVITAADITGREIMEKVYNRTEGDSRQSRLKMVLINKFGDERIREIEQYEKSFGQIEKKIMFFISPQDVRGTSFMNWSYVDKRSDDQWIYLPALRKVKRISAENRSDNFMGSDFTYDDLGDRNLNEDKHQLLREEELKGEECYVIKSVPVEEDYIYSRTVTWVIKDKWIGLKKEFYDREGKLLKVLENKEYKEVDGILTIFNSEMHNVQSDHRTRIQLSNVSYNIDVTEDMFTERMMKRGL